MDNERPASMKPMFLPGISPPRLLRIVPPEVPIALETIRPCTQPGTFDVLITDSVRSPRKAVSGHLSGTDICGHLRD